MATLPAGSSSHQATERLGSHHGDQLRRKRSLERRLDRRRRGRRAVALRARGDQGVGHLEQVRLAAAVLADDHVHAVAEAEIGRAEDGQIFDVESPEHSLLPGYANLFELRWTHVALDCPLRCQRTLV